MTSCWISTKEQRVVIKYCFKLGKSAFETFKMMKTTYGDVFLSHCKGFEWYSQFKSVHESLGDDPKDGRLSVAITEKNVECARVALSCNRRHTTEMLSGQLNISEGSIHNNLHYVFGKKKRFLLRIKHVRSHLYRTKNWFLLHDNAPVHSSLLATKLSKNQLLSLTARRTCWTWPRPTFFSSQSWKLPWKKRVLTMLRISNGTWRGY